MSFFQTASLVFISDFAAASASAVSGSGTNTGKAYSIKPTDGSGDFVFERGSDITATRVNKDGYIEKGRGNFLLQSNNFDTTWSKSNVNLTGSQSGYDGSNDAWILRKTGTTGNINQTVSSLTNVQTFSIYAKPGDLNWIRIIRAGKSIWVDLENQVTGSVAGGIIDVKITPINEWSRISLTINQTSTNTVIYPADGDNDISGTSGFIYIQDAQLEPGLVATDYIETTTAPLRAGLLEDEPRFDYHNSASASPNTCPSLLLEPSRTNLIPQSEYFGGYSNSNSTDEPNATTSPEGLTNATSFLEAATTGQHKLFTSLTFDGSSTYTFSIFAKSNGRDLYVDTQNSNEWGGRAWFDLTAGTANAVLGTADIEDYGNGWYRCIVTGASTLAGGNFIELLTSNGSSNSTTGDITKGVYIYGAQLEQASYATSYIPTYGTAATRGQETMGINTLDQVYSTDITLFLEVERLVSTSDINEEIGIVLNSTTSPTNRVTFYSTSNGRLRVLISDNTGTTDNLYSAVNAFEKGETIKIALKITNSGCTLFIDGSSVDTSSGIGEILGIDRISFIRDSIIKQYLMLPEALSDTDCEILTGATTYSSFAAMASALNYTVYE